MLIDHALIEKPVALKSLNVDGFNLNYPSWLNDKELNKYTEARFTNYSIDDVKNFILKCNEANNIILLGIYFKDKHIGNIKAEINPFHKTASIGILIGESDFHGQGIGYTAISLLSGYLFYTLKLHKINAGLYKSNIASFKAFEKAGFETEYTKKQHVINDGGVREDVLVMVKYAS